MRVPIEILLPEPVYPELVEGKADMNTLQQVQGKTLRFGFLASLRE